MATYRKLLKNRAGDTILPVVDVLNYLYPVGSIYMSATMSTASQVMAAFGGTWEAWGAGRVPVGVDTADTDFDTAEETGGRKWSGYCDNNWKINNNAGASQQVFINYSSKYTPTTGDQTNMPPYITCYMYKRTA